MRYVPSKNYYARFRSRGKLVWKSLDTTRISIAQRFFAVSGGMEVSGAAAMEARMKVAGGKLRNGAHPPVLAPSAQRPRGRMNLETAVNAKAQGRKEEGIGLARQAEPRSHAR